ncbi:hypothetical protein V6N11_016741 [Hibiscus sabdariffa]|uniref:Uncharacterized protein n=1 Tax=Hibiscus sabdariffa TaxID=183260 RepID=A0ABR2TVW2_9ROSI
MRRRKVTHLSHFGSPTIEILFGETQRRKRKRRGEPEVHDNGFGSLMSDESLTATVFENPEIGLPMSVEALTAFKIMGR